MPNLDRTRKANIPLVREGEPDALNNVPGYHVRYKYHDRRTGTTRTAGSFSYATEEGARREASRIRRTRPDFFDFEIVLSWGAGGMS